MTKLFCLPVSGARDRFVVENRGTTYDLPRLEVLTPYFQKHYEKRLDSTVEIEGVVYRATVYVPQGIEDSAYAIVGRSGLPEGSEPPSERIRAILQSYWTRRRQRIQLSDSLSGSHSSFHQDEFVPPRFRPWGRHDIGDEAMLTWREIQKHARVAILGPPGTGKTTCLRMLAITGAAEERTRKNLRVPVFIPLRTLRGSDRILDRAASELSLPANDDAFIELLESGRLTLLLDGLDEVEERLGDEIVGQIFKLAREHPDLGLVVSTRGGDYQSNFPDFLHVRILPLSIPDRKEWARRRFRPNNEHAREDCLRLFADRPSFDEETVTPLMLALTASVFEGSGYVPDRVSNLILRYVETLVEKWDAERGVKRWKYRPFDAGLTVRVLCRTAFNSTFESASRFSDRVLSGWESEWADKVDANDFLKYVWKGSNLVEPADQRGTWHFRNRAVREVLCAKHLVERTDDSLLVVLGKQTELILPVWLYACQISQDASPVLKTVMDSAMPLFSRAEFVVKVLAQEIALRENVQNDAHSFLSRAFLDLSEKLCQLERKADDGRLKISIGTRLASGHDLIRCSKEILTALFHCSTPQKRLRLDMALMREKNWLIEAIHPLLTSDYVGAQVLVSGTSEGLTIEVPDFGANP